MSRQLVRTRLLWHKGPLAQVVADPLFEVLNVNHYNNLLLDDVCSQVLNYEGPFHKHEMHPKTSDGYGWFSARRFSCQRGKIVILFPWAQDWEKQDGSQFDRSIAVYTKGVVTREDVTATISDLAFVLSREFKAREESGQQTETAPACS